jgi:hypothetical protein
MLLGYDFKYKIPEMDRLLGAAADAGIHLQHDLEKLSYRNGGKFIVQVVTGNIDGVSMQIMAAQDNPAAREETE